MVVTISGSVDALTSADLTRELIAQIEAGRQQILLDLGKVDYMSSAGLRSILAALKESRQHGGDLRIAAPQPGVAKILKMSGFNNILKVFESAAEGVESFGR
jgi:anti-anti-sigma factor